MNRPMVVQPPFRGTLVDPNSGAVLGTERVVDGDFTVDPAGSWTLGSGWSWDNVNHRAAFTGTGGPISSLAIDDGGTAYTNADTITVSTGSADATYTATVSGGIVTALTPVSPGTAYTAGSGKATTGGTGTGLKVSVLRVTNGAALSQSLPATDPTDTYYSVSYDSQITGATFQVSFSIQGYSGSGQVRADIGVVSSTTQLPYDFQQNGNFTILLTASNPVVSFTPTADFVGAITNVSIKPIAPAAATLRISDASGQFRVDLRSGGPNYNTFLGLDAGRNNLSTKGWATAVGYDALFSNISSFNCTAFGAAALYANTTGSSNTAVGESTLQYNTTGSNNTAVGFVALGANTTGSNNTAFGIYALNANTTASSNTAVGNSALKNTTTGSQNTAVGEAALFTNRNGSRNTAVGFDALYANTTGGDCTAVGYNALSGNTTATNNTAVGRNALGATTTGGSNTAVGFQALQLSKSGTGNAAIGDNALADVTTGGSNTAIGHNTGRGITTGSNNTIIGGSVTGLSATLASAIVIADGAGNIRVDYAKTTAATWTFSGAFTNNSSILSSGATGGIGYATGAGGAVTQATSRTTGVTLNKATGQITTNGTSLAAGATAKFIVTNSAVAATDTVQVSIGSASTTDQTDVKVQRVAAGAFDIVVANRHASTAETGAIVINFAVIKGVAA